MKMYWLTGRKISFWLVMRGGGSAVTTWKVIFPTPITDY
jgi:hypothetical protein